MCWTHLCQDLWFWWGCKLMEIKSHELVNAYQPLALIERVNAFDKLKSHQHSVHQIQPARENSLFYTKRLQFAKAAHSSMPAQGCLTSAGQPTCRILIKRGHLSGKTEFARAKCAHKHILTDKRLKKFKVSRLNLMQLCNALSRRDLAEMITLLWLSVTKLEVGGLCV